MDKEKIKCYMCEKVATSNEHVPPKCLFPEMKDINKKNYRENLITVPSCEKHNLKKSKDDEFLMVSIAGIIGNNSIGYMHKFTKVNRAIKRSANKLLETVLLKKQVYLIKYKNSFIDIIWGTPDMNRLVKCFESIIFGIYYHHYKKRFIGSVKILMNYLYYKTNNTRTFNKFIKHRAEIDFKKLKKYGNNQDIFYYQFIEPDKFGLIGLKLCFYENIEIYGCLIPKNVEVPSILSMDLMRSGIKTIIELEDKRYEFNGNS